MAVNALNQPLLIPAGLFRCPRCGTSAAIPTAQLTAIPTAQLISNGITPQGALPAGRCNRCEHPYAFTLGTPSTTTTGAANTQGAAALTVASGTAFSAVGAFVVIDAASATAQAEIVVVSAAGSSTSIPIAGTPLRVTHGAGATVQTAVLGPLGPMT
jgi:hypothetical protein